MLSLCLKVGTPKGVAESFDMLRSAVSRLWRWYQETAEFTSRETIQNRLHEGDLSTRHTRGPILTREHHAWQYESFRTGSCRTWQFYSLKKADFTRVLDIDFFKSGDDPENERTATLWETDIEMGLVMLYGGISCTSGL